MNHLLFMLLLAASHCTAQRLTLDPSTALPTPPAILPGYFHNNLTSTGTQILNAEPYSYNCLRTFEVTWKLRTTADHVAFISAVRSLKAWHEADAKRAEVVVIQINAMPSWLSSSSDTSRVSSGDNVRYYETVKPADYLPWDSLMRDMATVIKEWNFTPYYELWNEPELFFWNGTEAELIELYRHTAMAIKSADPQAKIGGFGMNYWHHSIGGQKINTIGYYPDSLADRTAALAHLIDTCAASGTPLDFISWHFFTVYPGWAQYGFEYFQRKLASRGFPQTVQIVTEYNAAGMYRERDWHAPFILSFIDRVKSYPGFHHAFASYQDFSGDLQREFFGDYGSISRNGLIKPVHHALMLLSRMFRTGTTRIDAQSDAPLTVFASAAGDTIRTLISNYVAPPQLAGYDALLFGEARLNTNDLYLAGYDSWGEIDSTIQGLLPPQGDVRIVSAFQAARTAYLLSLTNQYRPIDLVVTCKDLNQGSDGLLCRIDSTHNNNIFRYDSLVADGHSRNQAVSVILSDQALRVSTVRMEDSTFRITVPPNGIVYLELLGNTGQTSVEAVPDPVQALEAYPNPFADLTTLRFIVTTSSISILSEKVSLRIYDLLGREVAVLVDGFLEPGQHEVTFHHGYARKGLRSGVYQCLFTTRNSSQSKTLILVR